MALSKFSKESSSGSDSDLERLLSLVKRRKAKRRLFKSYTSNTEKSRRSSKRYIYRKLKQPNSYTGDLMHGLSKNVGEKPGVASKRKGPSNVTKPDIETYVDPFNQSSMPNVSELNRLQGPSNSSSSSSNPPVSAALVASLPQSVATESVVSSGLICQLNVRPQSVTLNQGPTILPVLSNHPFQIKFLTAAIKVCAGCRGGYDRGSDGRSAPPPPKDLCLVRKEQHLYYNVVNARQQYSSLSNVHYHANTTCPRLRCPDFSLNMVEIPDSIRERLQPEHWMFLLVTFGIV